MRERSASQRTCREQPISLLDGLRYTSNPIKSRLNCKVSSFDIEKMELSQLPTTTELSVKSSVELLAMATSEVSKAIKREMHKAEGVIPTNSLRTIIKVGRSLKELECFGIGFPTCKYLCDSLSLYLASDFIFYNISTI